LFIGGIILEIIFINLFLSSGTFGCELNRGILGLFPLLPSNSLLLFQTGISIHTKGNLIMSYSKEDRYIIFAPGSFGTGAGFCGPLEPKYEVRCWI
jgi:hypothetical protein